MFFSGFSLARFGLLALAASAIAAPAKRDLYDYDQEPVQGVNLGGWLLLEPWITPSLFQAFGAEADTPPDEYHYTQWLGPEEAESRLRQHWDTFITRDDFAEIKALGLNTVRIPVGYWAWAKKADDPYVQGALDYVIQAVSWAREFGLKVWIDVHGAPGSQNGFDNSGLRDNYGFLDPDNMALLVEVWEQVVAQFGGSEYSDVISGLEFLNEPLGPAFDMTTILQLYDTAYAALRGSQSSTALVLHDAFMSVGYFNGKYVPPNNWGVVLDHHRYQIFTQEELARSLDEHVAEACLLASQSLGEDLWNVVGEWSAALTDCTWWLNGVGVGYRYDGSYWKDGQGSEYMGQCAGINDITQWTDEKREATRRYVEAQMEAGEMNNGWIFWTWKTEGSIEWDLRLLAQYGMFPQPLSDRKYGKQCQ